MATQVQPSARQFNPQQWRIGSDDKAPPPDPQATMLTCTVLGPTPRFITPDQSFAIWSAVAEPEGENAARPVTIKGALGRVNPGEMLACRGKWKRHAQHGWSFEITDYRSALPTSAEGVITWLKVKVDGVGPTFAKAIVDHFGADKVFMILDEDPTKLREIRTQSGRKLPEKQVERAIEAWDSVKAIRQIETFLYSHDVSANLADKLYRAYGPEVIDILKENPYRITAMRGIGFKIADKVALSMGTPVDDPKRIMACILYVLEEAGGEGHTFLGLTQLCGHVMTALTPAGAPEPPREVRDPQKIVDAAGKLARFNRIVVEDDDIFQQRIYSKATHQREVRVATIVRHMLETPTSTLFPTPTRPTAPEGATEEQILELKLPSDAQWSAVEMVRQMRLSILSGGPGVGKTATTNTIVTAATAHDRRVALCAPTGKAARRMQELTGHPASTIHRLLEFSPFDGGFQRDETNPLEYDLVILDEASMLSLDLADSFFRAIGENTHVLLVGDPDQLAPVGAGKVLDDLIATEAVPRVHLAKIFRQAAKSMIVQNARRINRGSFPYLRREEAERELQQEMNDDFYWINCQTPESTAAKVIKLVTSDLPRAFNLNPVTDIMVLAPMREGKVGLKVLNAELEKRLNADASGNPKKPVVPSRGICVGSRIVQTVNSYEPGAEVMNGEIAVVLDYNDADKTCLLSLDDGERELWIPISNMDSYQLAWALTTHKSQGSEFKAVVVPASSAHWVMLTRSLYYTAVTRARELCVMVGEKKALSVALKNKDMKKRNSYLAQRVLDPRLSGQLF